MYRDFLGIAHAEVVMINTILKTVIIYCLFTSLVKTKYWITNLRQNIKISTNARDIGLKKIRGLEYSLWLWAQPVKPDL